MRELIEEMIIRPYGIFLFFMMTFNTIIAQTPPPPSMASEVWSEPIKLDILGGGAQPSISRKGDILVFYKGSFGIQMSCKQGNVWQIPFSLNSQINYGLARTPVISADGKKIYFIDYERSGGFGSWDLWVSEWSDSLNDWDQAKNLGPNINTDVIEWFCFTPDDQSLYFGRVTATVTNFLVSTWNDTLQKWGIPQSFDNDFLSHGASIDGLTMTNNKKKVYFSRLLDMVKHYEYELLVAYFDSSKGGYGDPMRLNINAQPPDSVPWYNPGNLGYDAYPSITEDGKFLYFESDRGPDSNGNNYHYIYYSQLLIDENGDTVTNITNNTEQAIQEFELFQNYPNPFNPVTNIVFTLNLNAHISIRIYDLNGREIKQLINGFYNLGHHSIVWDGKDRQNRAVSSGVYFYQIIINGQIRTKKAVLLN
jgi:Tol biopolymer transport system component